MLSSCWSKLWKKQEAKQEELSIINGQSYLEFTLPAEDQSRGCFLSKSKKNENSNRITQLAAAITRMSGILAHIESTHTISRNITEFIPEISADNRTLTIKKGYDSNRTERDFNKDTDMQRILSNLDKVITLTDTEKEQIKQLLPAPAPSRGLKGHYTGSG